MTRQTTQIELPPEEKYYDPTRWDYGFEALYHARAGGKWEIAVSLAVRLSSAARAFDSGYSELDLLLELEQELPEESPAQIDLLCGLAEAYGVRQPTEAIRCYEAADRFAVERSDPSAIAEVRWRRGVTLMRLEQPTEAIQWLESALAWNRLEGSRASRAVMLDELAVAKRKVGELEEAEALHDEAVGLLLAAGQWSAQIVHLGMRTDLAYVSRDLGKAAYIALLATEVADLLDQDSRTARLAGHAALWALMAREIALAQTLARRALDSIDPAPDEAASPGHKDWLSKVRGTLGCCYANRGVRDAAVRELDAAIDLAQTPEERAGWEEVRAEVLSASKPPPT